MFNQTGRSSKKALGLLGNIRNSFCTSCDANEEEELGLFEQSNAIQNEKFKVKTPMQFENLRGTLMQGSANTFDGFRMVVQKQVNLNTVVNHFYWMGAQQMPAPIYQYRIILPFDESVVNVATDMDFNVEGEVKMPIAKNIQAKSNFLLGERKSFTAELEVTDESSATQLQYTTDLGNSFAASYMQAVTPSVTLGGVGQYSMKKKALQMGFGGVYDKGEHLLGAQWGMDSNLRILYLRRVNMNRVHLSTDLHVDENMNSQMSVGAEYTMKQSKLHMSLDSGLLIKSSLSTTVAPGTEMQFCAEMQQAANHYRFGLGVMMG